MSQHQGLGAEIEHSDPHSTSPLGSWQPQTWGPASPAGERGAGGRARQGREPPQQEGGGSARVESTNLTLPGGRRV